MIQMSIFDMIREPIRITKPIRLIELFAGYGSQAMALERILRICLISSISINAL